MRRLALVGMVAAGALCATSASAFDDTAGKPLYEIGIFGGALFAPDYPASNQSHFHYLPLPYIVYRGSYFQFNGTSAQGELFGTPRVGLDLSADVSFETESDDTARSGMPRLDYLGEIGPRLRLLLAHDAAAAKVDLELPIRAVLSTNFTSRLNYRGWVAAPELAYTNGDFLGTDGTFKIGLASTLATSELMNYFYGVAPVYATPTRPQFTARAGYLGSGLDVSYRVPVSQRVTLFSLADAAYYGGATNEASPLFKRKYGLTFGLGATYSFYVSDERAPPEPMAPPGQESVPIYGSAPPSPPREVPDLAVGALGAGPPVHVARPAPPRLAATEPPPDISEPAAPPKPLVPASHEIAGKPLPLVTPEPAEPPRAAIARPAPILPATAETPLLAPGGPDGTASSDGEGLE